MGRCPQIETACEQRTTAKQACIAIARVVEGLLNINEKSGTAPMNRANVPPAITCSRLSGVDILSLRWPICQKQHGDVLCSWKAQSAMRSGDDLWMRTTGKSSMSRTCGIRAV
eukprot:SAG31_NODE_2225_length_6150_cov_2.229549_5_plen_113_part_00